MYLPIKVEWQRLRDTVDQVESQLAYSGSLVPSEQMCKFLIAGEDHRFYRHPGVDLVAICRAAWKTAFCGYRQGASTIAMQLVRTITGQYKRTWQRKIREIVLALRLTQYVEKDRLPILYLWVAYYGWRMNSFDQACSRLQINPRSISELDAAKFVARLKYPEPREGNIDRLKKIQYRERWPRLFEQSYLVL
jgi:membrane carboxypeptidase/penicillin-binding protein PbpC